LYRILMSDAFWKGAPVGVVDVQWRRWLSMKDGILPYSFTR
jgi:hypothetical protein